MSIMTLEPPAIAASRRSSVRFRATDVTESHDVDVEDMDSRIPAGEVAQTLAQRMDLPTTVPWTLRNDQGVFLDDTKDIGAQVEEDARLTLTPKAHMG